MSPECKERVNLEDLPNVYWELVKINLIKFGASTMRLSSSSMVEQAAVNGKVVGSSPTYSAMQYNKLTA